MVRELPVAQQARLFLIATSCEAWTKRSLKLRMDRNMTLGYLTRAARAYSMVDPTRIKDGGFVLHR